MVNITRISLVIELRVYYRIIRFFYVFTPISRLNFTIFYHWVSDILIYLFDLVPKLKNLNKTKKKMLNISGILFEEVFLND